MTKYKTEEEVLENYDSSKYRTPDGYTSDIAIFTIVSEKVLEKAPPKMRLNIMLIKRADIDNEGNPNIEGGNGHFLEVSWMFQKEKPLIRQLREN